MATIDIGKLKPVFKGTYDNSTAYVLDDIVYYNGSSYVAKTSTTGNLPTDTTKWNVLASGSGGIWDSTLSIGTAGQVVQVNSGASALEFADASGGYILQSKVAQYYGTTQVNTTQSTPAWVGSIDSAYNTQTITMTPASTSSKFEIYMQCPVHFSGGGYGHIYVYRDIGGGGYTQLTGGKHWGDGDSSGDPYMIQTIKHWDAPNTTSDVTYRMYFTWHSGTGNHASLNNTGSYNSKHGGMITAVNEIDGSKLTLS